MSDEKWFVIAGCEFHPNGGIFEFATFDEAKNKALELVRNDFYERNVNDISGKYKCEYIVNQGGEFVLMVISSLFSGRN